MENRSLLGTPDLLGYTHNGNFFTLELKYTSVHKIRFSPHQISFHVKHNLNTFILVACGPDKGKVRLYPGSRILELVDSGLKLEPLACGLDACVLESLNAWALTTLLPELGIILRGSKHQCCPYAMLPVPWSQHARQSPQLLPWSGAGQVLSLVTTVDVCGQLPAAGWSTIVIDNLITKFFGHLFRWSLIQASRVGIQCCMPGVDLHTSKFCSGGPGPERPRRRAI